jgi:hypothetical protein
MSTPDLPGPDDVSLAELAARLREDAALAAAVLAAEASLHPRESGHDRLLRLLRDLADRLARHVAELAAGGMGLLR